MGVRRGAIIQLFLVNKAEDNLHSLHQFSHTL